MNRHWRFSRGGAVLWAVGGTALSLAVGLGGINAAKLAKPEAAVGKRVAGFALQDTTGRSRSLAEFKGKKALVLVFTGTECPISNSYAAPLSALSEKYAPRGAQFLAINANPGEDLAAVSKHAAEYRLAFPVLKDADQVVADALSARVTPEVFVLDEDRTVRYRGRVDDGYASRTQRRKRVSSRDLEQALEAVLAGKPIAKPVTQVFGCAIARPERGKSTAARVTYHKDVSGILMGSCQNCHRPGQVAPFSLLTYADAKNWAQEIKAFTATRQMPPWKAEPGHGEFEDVRRLSDEQIRTLAAWVDAGAPEGNRKDAPAPKQWGEGWMLGNPDLVLTIPQFSVEATGEDVFRCFVLPTGLTEDKEVVAVEIRPGNPRVVHHVLNFIDTAGRGRKLDEQDAAPGYSSGPGGIGFLPSGGVGGWAPGNLPRFLPKGIGRRLPKGSDIVAQMHYHKTGKPETDSTSVGLYFAKQPVEKQMRTWPLTNLGIDIPPNAARHEVKASMKVPADVHLITVTPHMHLLGREMKVWATLPDGTRKELCWIKDWDYRWQDTYRYKEGIPIPKGSQLDLVAYFDNSSANPLNPHTPPKRVTFGEQTTDEMCFAFFELVMDQEPKTQFNPARFFGGN